VARLLVEFRENEAGKELLKANVSEIAGLLPKSTYRGEIIRTLTILEAREAGPEIAKLLGDEQLSGEALNALVYLRAVDTGPSIVSLLSSSDVSVRTAAIRALGTLGVKEAAPVLVKLLSDKTADVRESAAAALGRIGDRGSLAWLVALLQDPDGRVRYAAALSLCRMGRTEGMDALLKNPWAGDLMTLNGLRRKDSWERLGSKRTAKTMNGTPDEILEIIALEVGMRRVGTNPDTTRRSVPSGRFLREALEETVVNTGYQAIVDDQVIRIVPDAEAVAYWRKWWASEKAK
jgi:hypothetical protein